MAYDPEDLEAIALIARSYGRPFSAIAEEARQLFGAERAWPVHVIAAYVHLNGWRLFRSRYQRDAEVMAFLADHTDIVPIVEIVRRGVATFGKDRFPTRSTVHRISSIFRAQALKATLASPPGTLA